MLDTRRIWSLPALIVVIAIGCGDDKSTLRDQLSKAREKWVRANVTSYRFVTQKNAMCCDDDCGPALVGGACPSYAVQIVDGQITKAEQIQLDGSAPIDVAPDSYREYFTVPGHFDVINRVLDDVYRVRAEYDDELGYPLWIYVQYSSVASDSITTYTIGEFTRM